jgi:hypothetical protein
LNIMNLDHIHLILKKPADQARLSRISTPV